MSKRLAFAGITVMAGCAIAGICTRVVKRRTSKSRGVEMAIVAFLSGRYVVRQFTDTDHIVVARRAAASSDTDMTKGARAKGTRGMANTAILNGRHVFIC